jgi:signal transduction histidine kinase
VDVDVARLARGVIDDFVARAREKGVAVELDADDALPLAHTDPRLLRVLLSSLVGDAVDACPAGTVAIAVSRGARGHVIRVGGARVSSVSPDGLALGRVIVRHVADALGALLEVDGRGGPGTAQVTVTLPSATTGAPAIRAVGE